MRRPLRPCRRGRSRRRSSRGIDQPANQRLSASCHSNGGDVGELRRRRLVVATRCRDRGCGSRPRPGRDRSTSPRGRRPAARRDRRPAHWSCQGECGGSRRSRRRKIETDKPGVIPAALARDPPRRAPAPPSSPRRSNSQTVRSAGPISAVGAGRRRRSGRAGAAPARIGDGGFLVAAPPKPRGAVGGAAVEAAVGGSDDQRRGVAGPAQILDRAGNVAERLTRRPVENERSILSFSVRSESEGEPVVDGRPARQRVASRAVGQRLGRRPSSPKRQRRL